MTKDGPSERTGFAVIEPGDPEESSYLALALAAGERLTPKQLRLTRELGEEFPVRYDAPEEERERQVQAAIDAAMAALPTGVVFEIRAKSVPVGTPYEYGRIKDGEHDADRLARRTAEWSVAWYWTSADPRHFNYYGGMKQEPLFRVPIVEAKEPELGGYLVIARLRVEPSAGDDAHPSLTEAASKPVSGA